VARGLAFVDELAPFVEPRHARYWLTGPAEDGFGPELDRILAVAHAQVAHGRAEHPQDAYAAADVVVFPSSWEGFGNPVIEATVADRPVAVAHYPVLDELRALGLQLFSIDHPDAVAAWLAAPDAAVRAANRACLQQHFDLAHLPARIEDALTTVGWRSW
jgi:glycosyltransferase involved in cell wall biosynthesis